MACGSGCCFGPPASPVPPAQAPLPASTPIEQTQKAEPPAVDEGDCQDSCCDVVVEPPPKSTCAVSGSGCCGSSSPREPENEHGSEQCKTADDSPALKAIDAEADCKDACCARPQLVVAGATGTGSDCKDSCCAAPIIPKATGAESDCKDACCTAPELLVPTGAELDCKDECCTAPEPVVPDATYSACCEGKASPCCDTSCLDRLAQRSCEEDSQCDTKSQDGKPCTKHSRSTRDRYAARLEALGCICRALIALGQESCCIAVERPSGERARGSKRGRRSVDSCCATPATVASAAVKTCGRSAARRRSRDSCGISSGRASPARGGCAKGCCGQPKVMPPSVAGSCSDACCGEEKESGIPDETVRPVSHHEAAASDPEKGFTGSDHVILSISGMTCTGCETKLSRTLAVVPGIRNLKTSLILSRAEFDLDVAANSVTEVVKHLERTTEFTCERVSDRGATIDVIPSGDCEEFLKRDYPLGVSEMTLIDEETVRVAFDAKIIGARDLVSRGFGNETPLKLAPPRADPTLDAGGKHVRRVGYMTILSALLTIPVLVLAWAPLPEHEIAYGSASLALATIIQVVVAGPFYPTSIKSLIFSRVIEMDLLIVLSTTTAYIFSVVAFGYLASGSPLPTGEFFETSTLLVTLIMVGRYLGALARQKAVESISVRSLQTTEAILVGSDGQESVIDARLLQYGDCFRVMPDSRVPTDGTVVSGTSEIDESMVTGESRPVEKKAKSNVVAGSINGSGTLVVRLTRLPGENTISTIASMVDEAKLSKPRIQDMADRVASYFVPVVLLLTVITFVVWVATGVAVRKQPGSEAVVNAITFAISVLIVSCPCAIGLAVPMVVVIATGVAADRGVIFKTAESIEIAHMTSHVVFDKTGTLTEGKLAVVSEAWTDGDGQDETNVCLLLGLVGSNKHPVSAAVATHLRNKSIAEMEVKDVKSIPGKGIEGRCASGRVLRAGNSRWLGLSTEPSVSDALGKGYTSFCFTIDGSLAATFGLEDSLRPDALETASRLQARGITVSILSGDDDGAVRGVAAQLHIADQHVRSRCAPADKKAYIQALQSAAKPGQKPVVIFCGDGTNDAVALAQATIGVHVNGGTDVARSAADLVLVRPRLAGVLTAIDTSRAAVRRIAFNFAWSFAYNLFAVLLAAGAFTGTGTGTGAGGVRIPPQFAGLGEVVSVLPVIAAAVLLRWAKV
ncbi:hypothetical protein DL766_002019 [Monosporascus sp. MC13-8B]|nr:hypothetical protein DL763_003872 [Monosporascus cannonballus]RYP36357.1 hypothetical protein DL766_002019 [Monosporascus sp. MC13-8B]